MVRRAELSAIDQARNRIHDHYRQDEEVAVRQLLEQLNWSDAQKNAAHQRAKKLVLTIRAGLAEKGGIEALLSEFSLSNDEGIVLMCLAEALLRVPDSATMDRLIRDKLSGGDWSSHLGNSDSLFVNASAWGLLLTGKLMDLSEDNTTTGENPPDKMPPDDIGRRKTVAPSAAKSGRSRYFGNLLKTTLTRLGEPAIRAAMRYAMEVMGEQFVMGVDIESALARAEKMEQQGYLYSYDMLGEGARSAEVASRYFQHYMEAIERIGERAGSREFDVGRSPQENPGISVKLSALHPRFEFSQRQRVLTELLPRLNLLVMAAKNRNIGLTIDAEEAERLDLSLELIEASFLNADLGAWQGFGMVVQAYQKRAIYVIEWARQLACRGGRKIALRLVKGAYWDSEIKWSQQLGLKDYPVFTRKASTDLSYQLCAQKLLLSRDVLYPQFATHNAYTVASILEMAAAEPGRDCLGFEFQRLHGMGESLYEALMRRESIPCRIYAPVGEHRDLLAYLVRRLLENGANSSFVNNIMDPGISAAALLADPYELVDDWETKRNSNLPIPADLYRVSKLEHWRRLNSSGLDLTDVPAVANLTKILNSNWHTHGEALNHRAVKIDARDIKLVNPADNSELLGRISRDSTAAMEQKLAAAQEAFFSWSGKPVSERAIFLRNFADYLESWREALVLLCCKEAGKTIADSLDEIREAVDFCRYYASSAEQLLAAGGNVGWGPRGVVLCISPWNFPVAIFVGQIVAALVCGNTVMAKPALQTSLIAQALYAMMLDSGLPLGVVNVVLGEGRVVGEHLLPDARIKGIMFTGSNAVGSWLNRALAARPELDIPLIAETGGQNAMIVDSTALPEQVVDDVLRSGFYSAGQRCSALRVLFLQQDIADSMIEMLRGAMEELAIGDPMLLSTDIGPIIDKPALDRLCDHRARMHAHPHVKLLHACELPEECIEEGIPKGNFFTPLLYEIESLAILREEVFGPVVHIIRFAGGDLDTVMAQISASHFGLTLGVHSRIQAFTERVAGLSQVGNIYVNRNMIGAVVGAQPFGGRELSGTGPKAGGPHYLSRLLYKKEALNALSDSDPYPNVDKFGSFDEEAIPWDEIHAAQCIWRCYTSAARYALLKNLIAVNSAFVGGDSLAEYLAEFEQINKRFFPATENLPGPTGESNQLLLESRGVVAVVIADSKNWEAGLKAIFAALTTGNAVVVVAPRGVVDSLQVLAKSWRERGLSQDLVTVAPVDMSLICCAKFKAVLASGNLDFLKDIQRLLADRGGVLTPLIYSVDPYTLLQGLLLEKTISIDTTAAGGNATLLMNGS